VYPDSIPWDRTRTPIKMKRFCVLVYATTNISIWSQLAQTHA
jgi:hypothetical protein